MNAQKLSAFLMAGRKKQTKAHQEKRKNWRNFRERSQGDYGVCCEKIVFLIYGYYQRVAAKFAISELHFSRG